MKSFAQGKTDKMDEESVKKMDNRVNLTRDGRPYGLYYAYEYLSYLFPDAEILTSRTPLQKKGFFGQNSVDEVSSKITENKGKTLQFVVSHEIVPDAEELTALMNFVYEGNTAFCSSYYFGEELLKKLGLKTLYNEGRTDVLDSLKVGLINPISGETEMYAYPGKRYDNAFVEYPANTTTILGRNRHGEPNFIRIQYTDGGSIYLHLAPLTFSNFFLLHKNNKSHYDAIMSYLPSNTKLVVWSEYFKNKESGNSTSRAFSYMMNQPALAASVLSLILLFLLLFIFESKRKQRLVPILTAPKNSSLDFVKTVGRLYYQRRDNKNLVFKMTSHFLDYVRVKFNLPTSHMDESFEKKLAYKSGVDFKEIHDLIYQANFLGNEQSVSDADLIIYNNQLENFYKKA